MSENPTQSLLSVGDAITQELSKTQQQLDSVKQQLTESQRLATIGTIAAVIAHEFNNLLTPIVSYSQFALDSAQSDKPDLELIKKAMRDGGAPGALMSGSGATVFGLFADAKTAEKSGREIREQFGPSTWTTVTRFASVRRD